MPRTGSAGYTGPLRGLAINGSTIAGVEGSSRLVADFANARVQALLFLNRLSQPTLPVSGAGTIQASRFVGNLASGGYAGSFDGGFFGPQAAEMGLGFVLTGTDGTQIAGAGASRK